MPLSIATMVSDEGMAPPPRKMVRRNESGSRSSSRWDSSCSLIGGRQGSAHHDWIPSPPGRKHARDNSSFSAGAMTNAVWDTTAFVQPYPNEVCATQQDNNSQVSKLVLSNRWDCSGSLTYRGKCNTSGDSLPSLPGGRDSRGLPPVIITPITNGPVMTTENAVWNTMNYLPSPQTNYQFPINGSNSNLANNRWDSSGTLTSARKCYGSGDSLPCLPGRERW